MTISVTVDPRRCVASGTCLRIAPLHFELAADSHAVPTRPSFAEGDLELLYEAEESCPTEAIQVLKPDA
jgi:ferredoxin